MSERDQRNAARKVENLRARVERVAAAQGGRLFNSAGDGFMLEFGSAGSALAAIQEILDKRPRGEPPIRIGAHVGDVVVTATSDLLGHGVNVAARLQELAEPGTALVSAEFRSMARTSPQAAFESKGQKPLDNIEQRVQTFEILSKRQRFARFVKRAFVWLVIALIAGALLYFSPAIYRFVQRFMPQQPEASAPAQQAASLDAESPASPEEVVATRLPGTVFRDCAQCPEMVVLPAGLFVMGSPASEAGRNRDEGPQREVSIAPFAMGKFEVTFAQWDACLAGGGCNGYSPPDQGWGRGDRPVTHISWNDAHAYLTWLNQQAGGSRYRLATEAEWEYAARSGTGDAYAFGPRVTATQATFEERQTTPAGAHAANAFGLADLHGNAAEWVEDCYASSYDRAPVDGAAVHDSACTRRVFRGGGYADEVRHLRAAARQSAASDQRRPGVGFRVARTLD